MAFTGQPVPSTTYQQARAKVSDGKSVRVAVPENTTIEAGKFYYLDGFLGASAQSVVTGAGETAEVILNIENAEFETDQIDSTKDFNKGASVYWDSNNKRFTTDITPIFAGVVSVAKDTNNVIWFVLRPGFTPDTTLDIIGDLTDLETTEKSDLVGAINEVNTAAGAAQTSATTALARVAANVVCADDASAEDVRTALRELLASLEAAGLMEGPGD